MRLAALIDLAILMRRDRDFDAQRLARRDAAIGTAIGASRLSDADTLAAWVKHRNGTEPDKKHQPTIGEQVVGLLLFTYLGLGIAGFFLGLTAMASALAFEKHTNVIPLWSILIGSQILLLALWMLAILPTRWTHHLPGVQYLQHGVRFIGLVPTRLFFQLLRWCAPLKSHQLHEFSGEFQRSGSLYGNLARWVGMLLTQVFALTFNLGLLLAFLALSYGNDPTFGWRSTMLTSEQMHKIMETVAWPWSAVWPEAVPTLEVVSYVKDSSKENVRHTLDPEQRIKDVRMWASLWPFLLASLCFYGLLPRIGTLLVSLFQVHRHARPDPQHNLALRTLLSRLRRPRIVFESDNPANKAHDTLPGRDVPTCDWSDTPPVGVFQWSGIDLNSKEVAQQLRDNFGVEIAFCARVGELDPQQDEIALGRLTGHATGQTNAMRVVVLVESWESPDADYLDFLERLRQRVTSATEIAVVLCPAHRIVGDDISGHQESGLPNAEKIWRAFLNRSGDPNLSLTILPRSASPRVDP